MDRFFEFRWKMKPFHGFLTEESLAEGDSRYAGFLLPFSTQLKNQCISSIW